MRPRLLICLIALASVAQAQTPAKKGVTVTGHIYCADTNAPARLATVALEPVAILEWQPVAQSRAAAPDQQISFIAVQTGLDGSFLVPDVAPGDYYVVADKPGYISPFASVSSESLSHATAEERQRIMHLLPRVSVQAGLPATVDVRLERGAAISGTVLFDDGTPASGLPVRVLTREKQGDRQVWTPMRSSPLPMMGGPTTDDQGRYRLAGLVGRDYLVEVDLKLDRFEFGVSVGAGHEGGSSSINDVAKLAFYSGGTTRKRDTKPLRLSAGDEAAEDMTIPLSKLHTISGELTAAHDGHVINKGEIQLLDPDDKTELESAKVNRTDNRFYLRFVPEGDYILRAHDAADVTYEDIAFPPGYTPQTHEEVHSLHNYGTADQPLNVHEDTAGLVVALPEQTGAAKPAP